MVEFFTIPGMSHKQDEINRLFPEKQAIIKALQEVHHAHDQNPDKQRD